MPPNSSELSPDSNEIATPSLAITRADTVMAILGATGGGGGGIALGINSWAHGNADAVTGMYTTAGLGAVFISLMYAMLRSGKWQLPEPETK